MTQRLTGLIAATHTPFTTDGELNLAMVEHQSAHLLRSGVKAVFIGGTTGESHSLTVEERLALAQRWSEVVRGTEQKLIVHVGGNCLADARTLAAQAQQIGAHAIAALAPSYFKPKSLDVLIACCGSIASAAPNMPFYFYDIPVLTGVSFPMPEFLERASAAIPNLAGLKFTNPDLMAFQKCVHVQDGRFDVPWGVDEYLLAALACGATGAVGSSYNFAAPIYLGILKAFAANEVSTARQLQYRSVQLIDLLARYGYMAAAKAVMGFLNVPVGPARLPHTNLAPEELVQLRADLDQLRFFEWLA